MKLRRFLPLTSIGFFSFALLTPALNATVFTWSAGTNSNWDTTTANWTGAVWGNAIADQAVFGSTGIGAVAVTTTVNANAITFDNAGYTVSGSTITLASTTPTITANADASIGSILVGTTGLTKAGTGVLTLTGLNTYSGATLINTGTLTYSGAGKSSGAGTLALGTTSGSRAVLNINTSDTLTYNGTVNVGGTGSSSNGAGAINQTSGTASLMNNTAYVMLGNGGYGSYSISGGTMNMTSASGIRIGDNTAGLGVFNQSGGTVNATRFFVVGGNQGTGPSGVATITGGTLNGATAQQIIIGNGGSARGVMNVGTAAGGTGTVIANNVNGIRLGDAGSPTSILNLNSGTVQMNAGSINRIGTATGTVNFNGGTLKAGTTGLTLVDNTPNSINVYNGGVTVDTQALAASVSGNLLVTTGSGIYPSLGTIAVPSAGGTGYIGAPIVTITTSGSGTGALANATVSGGVVTGVTLTCPGKGYVAGDTVSFAFAGGGSLTAAATYVYTLAAGDLVANGSGGLTKIGTGTLTLSGASTYTGITSVNAGTLVLGSAGAVGSTGIVFLNGGGLQFSATNTLDLTATSRLKLKDGAVSAVDTNNQTVTFSNAVVVDVSGTGGLNKAGLGTLTLQGANTWTGNTQVTAGTLSLDYSTADTSKIANLSPLVLAGGTLQLTGGSHQEVVNNTTVSGTATITRTGGTATLALGTITRSGVGTLNFTAANLATTTLANDINGKLPFWITVGGLPAANDGSGSIVAYSAFTNVTRLGGALPNLPNADVQIVDGGTSGPITPATPGAATTVNTISQVATAGPASIAMGIDTLRLGAVGNLSVLTGAGALTITGGAITAGGADDTPGDLRVDNIPTVTLDLPVTDNGASVVTLTKKNTGALVLSGANTFTGAFTQVAGEVDFNHASAIGTGGWILGGGTFDNTSGTPVVNTAVMTQTWNSDPVFTGSNDLSFSGASVPLAANRTVTVNGNSLSIGGAISGAFALTKTGVGNLVLTGANTYSGASTFNAGTVTYSGAGASTGGGALALGTTTGSRAVVNIATTGTVNYYGGANTVNVGGSAPNAGGAGAINLSSGTLNLMNSGTYMMLGNGGYGSMAVSGGSINFPGSAGIRIGDNTNGIGIYNQTAGSVTTGRIFVLGGNAGASNPKGVATITGGSLTGGGPFQYMILGNDGTAQGTLNVGTLAGGSGLLVANDNIQIGSAGNPTGIVNLNSGTLQFNGGSIVRTLGTGILNLNGATVKAGNAGLTPIGTTMTSINVYNGGLVLDTQMFASTVSGNLLATTGNGIYPVGGSIAIPSAGGTGYIGAPLVTVTGGSGTGAMAVANVSGGVITGVTLTCPGQGYVAGDTVSFAFAGGGSLTAATTYVHTLTPGDLAANSSGGLTKTGAGTLSLSGANTYLGTTLVSAGTLAVNNTTGSGTGTGIVTVSATGTLAGTGVVTGTVTDEGTLAPGNAGVGTLSTGSLTLTAPAAYACDVIGSTADKVTVTGDLDVSGATLTVTATGTQTGTLVIASYTGTLTGTFGTVTGIPTGYSLVYNSTAKQIEIAMTGYASWSALNAAGEAANLDTDKDGVPNGVEYFMGQSGSSFTATPQIVNGLLTWPKDPTAIATYEIQTSENLTTWAPETEGVTDNGTSVTYLVPTDRKPLFVRLKVTTP